MGAALSEESFSQGKRASRGTTPDELAVHARWECDELLCHAQAKAHQINGEGGGT